MTRDFTFFFNFQFNLSLYDLYVNLWLLNAFMLLSVGILRFSREVIRKCVGFNILIFRQPHHRNVFIFSNFVRKFLKFSSVKMLSILKICTFIYEQFSLSNFLSLFGKNENNRKFLMLRRFKRFCWCWLWKIF